MVFAVLSIERLKQNLKNGCQNPEKKNAIL